MFCFWLGVAVCIAFSFEKEATRSSTSVVSSEQGEKASDRVLCLTILLQLRYELTDDPRPGVARESFRILVYRNDGVRKEKILQMQ